MRLPAFLLLCLLPFTVFSQPRCEARILRPTSSEKITRYETVEIGIRIPSLEKAFRSFLDDHTKGINPYTQHFLRLQFICYDKIYIASAFYMQECVADEKQNKYQPVASEWPWRVRFAVPDTGSWRCNILFGDSVNKSIPLNSGISFTCIPGNHHGYLQVAPDKKHFQYSDGTPFFVLGENITNADEPMLKGHPGIPPVYIAGYYDIYHYLEDLADNGGNYVRIGMPPWSTGIDPQANNIYDQAKACAIDSMLHIAEQRGLHVQLAIDLTKDIWKDDGSGNWFVAGPSPFKKPGMTEADLLKDSAALVNYDNYIRYIYSRWAFSPVVASIEVLGEHNRWEGYTGREKIFSDFFGHVQAILKNEFGDSYHMISTSTTNASYYEIFQSDAIAFIDRHHYDNDLRCNQKRYAIVHKRSLEKMNKPFLFGEMGMINGPVNESDADDFEHCNDISYHNALWSTFFMGGAGTGLYWWQWKNDTYRKSNYPILRFFLDSVVRQTRYVHYREWDKNGLETFYEIDSAKTHIAGWVHNTSYWWGNMMQDCRDRNGKEKFLPKDNDEAEHPESRAGNIFILKNLSAGKTYRVKFYDTRIKNTVVQSLTVKADWRGRLKLPMPDKPDCAFEIVKE